MTLSSVVCRLVFVICHLSSNTLFTTTVTALITLSLTPCLPLLFSFTCVPSFHFYSTPSFIFVLRRLSHSVTRQSLSVNHTLYHTGTALITLSLTPCLPLTVFIHLCSIISFIFIPSSHLSLFSGGCHTVWHAYTLYRTGTALITLTLTTS